VSVYSFGGEMIFCGDESVFCSWVLLSRRCLTPVHMQTGRTWPHLCYCAVHLRFNHGFHGDPGSPSVSSSADKCHGFFTCSMPFLSP